ncbi:hypothetical protein ACSBR2_030182 [Camellia fascicularis]
MNNLTNVVRIQNHQVIVRYVTSNESLHTISECMERLKCIPSLLDTPLFHFALSLMDNVDYREVMMCQPDDDHIIGWLSQKQMQSSTAVPFANLFGVRRGLITVELCAGLSFQASSCLKLMVVCGCNKHKIAFDVLFLFFFFFVGMLCAKQELCLVHNNIDATLQKTWGSSLILFSFFFFSYLPLCGKYKKQFHGLYYEVATVSLFILFSFPHYIELVFWFPWL